MTSAITAYSEILFAFGNVAYTIMVFIYVIICSVQAFSVFNISIAWITNNMSGMALCHTIRLYCSFDSCWALMIFIIKVFICSFRLTASTVFSYPTFCFAGRSYIFCLCGEIMIVGVKRSFLTLFNCYITIFTIFICWTAVFNRSSFNSISCTEC